MVNFYHCDFVTIVRVKLVENSDFHLHILGALDHLYANRLD